MAMTSQEAAYVAATFVTTGRVPQVAAQYKAWVDATDTPATGVLALLAAARSSKSPESVIASAKKFYETIENDAPQVTAALSPATGSTSGGTAVTVTGKDFLNATGVSIGGVAATSVVVVNDTTITCVTGAHSAGAVSVTVTTPAGTSPARANSFTYA